MTKKIKVGDKVRVISNDYRVSEDIELTVKRGPVGDAQGGNYYFLETDGVILGDHLVKANTKKQRITALEETVTKQGEEIAELKLIVHQLRVPSTIAQEEIDKAEWQRGEIEGVIEFEGQQYKKVDRKAREGDVVAFNRMVEFHGSRMVTEGKFYKTQKGIFGELEFKDDVGDSANVYGGGITKFVLEDVDVYELTDGYNPQIPILEESKVKSPNQQRAEVIEKAKTFVESITNGGEYVVPFDEGEGQWFLRDFDFVVNEPKRTIVVLCKSIKGKVLKRSIAKCMPTDVYNEHIGKAIALGRALGLDVSEFENAVQPTFAPGQKVYYESPFMAGFNGYYEIKGFEYNGDIVSKGKGILDKKGATIINDTNAEYEVNA